MIRWFGNSPPFSPVCEDVPHVPTPVGVPCSYCDEPFASTDRGYYYSGGEPVHYECFIRQIVGSVGHQQKRCHCFGGHEEDPIGVSRHEAARLAVALSEATQGGSLGIAYICPTCRRVSFNPRDLAERYCGACHAFEKGWDAR